MLKAFVTINCDECGDDFELGRVTASGDPMDWSLDAYELIGLAESTGWDFFRDRMRCKGCMQPVDERSVTEGDDYDEIPF